eukprot:CAMPEP_0197232322 /NCGR_PEP_ID=MMETSP1429-20130617/269_1 /TAXON_ID=49237 /ORGANISM="Chaetoceros  sp., Strain UNC1202" /LENGTH=98 /DNA_ID=CAMNT_0042690301 /DNA_START=42 /DNA_END=338 /DNA_ORIENTATION=-
MAKLMIDDCPAPWTIGRLPPACEVVMGADCNNRQTQRVKGMEPQFKVPRQRFITGLINFSIFSSRKGAELIEQLYQPGAAGCKRVKDEFEKELNDLGA